MQLHLTEEQEMLRDSLARLLGEESTGDRVRAAEPLGFDAGLWEQLAAFGVPGLRTPENAGGSGLGLFEAVLAAEQAGRHLASAPVVETMVANALLARSGHADASALLERALSEALIVTFVPRPVEGDEAFVVPGGAVARAALVLRDDRLLLVEAPADNRHAPNLAAAPIATWRAADGVAVAEGEAAQKLFGAALEEWKLLTAAALCGLGERALELAAEYANQRIQFDRPIGAFQGISHPLADAVSATDGGKLLVWDAVSSLAHGRDNAGALVSMAYGWAARAVAQATTRSIHTFGGYGLALSSDVQLYFRRAKGWPLLAGDPKLSFVDVSDRLWRGAAPALPDAGEVSIDFEFGPEAQAFGATVRKFFEDNLDDELRAHAEMTWDGYHPRVQKMLADANLLFPTWPEEYGGQNRDAYDFMVLREEYFNAGWTVTAVGVTRLVSETMFRYGSDELKREVLPLVTKGEAVFCLGYTEPGSGSDVGAAKTRAVLEGDEWVIDGQKMFNSGAHLAQYVFLLTRTNTEVSKHRGLTMFLVPLDTPGIEVFPFDTISNERSNATYFTGVRVPDRYRVGEVDGGWNVIRYALGLEHTATYWQPHQQMIDKVVAWGRETGRIDDPRVRERLGLATTRARISRLLMQRGIWCIVEKAGAGGEGPMSKLFSADAFLQDSDDLVDLTAPDSVLTGDHRPGSAVGLHASYRHGIASINYGGTSEVMRSLVGQMRLGLPRDR